MLNYKKPAFWMIIVAVIVCIVVAVCFMTNPRNRYYDITMKIPAGSEEDTVWYFDEEVSPKGDTLKLDTGDFYRGTLILQAVEGSTDIVEQTTQLQSDTPVTFQTQPGVWYRVGIRMGLNTGDNEISLKVRVRNAEIRIASGNLSDRKEAMEQEELEVALSRAEQEETEKREAAENERQRLQEELLENLGIKYEYVDGVYVVDGDMVFAYKKDLSGRTTNARYGTVTGELQTGQWYEIQIKNANGEWIDNSSKDIERVWEDIAYLINNGGTTEIDLNWEYVYGRLGDEHYRVVKKVMDYRAPGDYVEYDVYAEFDIGNGTASAESVTDWMDITLPTGYSIGSFDDAIGWMGGSLILPRSYVLENPGFAPIEWQYSGLISRIPAENAGVAFTNGLPEKSADGIPMRRTQIAFWRIYQI